MNASLFLSCELEGFVVLRQYNKVAGRKPRKPLVLPRHIVHRIFSLVDREARKALKRWMREVEGDSIKSHTCITKKKGTLL